MAACGLAIAAALPLRLEAQDRPSRPAAPAAPTQGIDPIRIAEDAKKPENVSTAIQIAFVLTVLSLAPALLVMVTSFTRIVIVLSFVRRAIGTQELPPNQIITGLALILTFMVMTPTFSAIRRDALDPYTTPVREKQISSELALSKAVGHLRVFMFQHARVQDLKLFMDITKQPSREGGWRQDDVPTEVLIPAFVISELRRSFVMGFALFLPFMVIDLVVSATLISMGMMVLPPFFISLPFKILLFVLVDGWHLVVGSLVQSFYG
jgi:flagellar biosynthetic protein FliP